MLPWAPVQQRHCMFVSRMNMRNQSKIESVVEPDGSVFSASTGTLSVDQHLLDEINRSPDLVHVDYQLRHITSQKTIV